MDDLIKSLKAQLYDRVTSPLLSSFMIAWALWNHRLFLVLLTSDLKIKEKFDYVDNILYPTWREVLGPGLALPLASALILLFIYPLPGRWVYQYVRREQKRLKEIQQRIDDETPLTREDARELYGTIRRAQEQSDAKDKMISELRSAIANLEMQIEGIKAGGSQVEHTLPSLSALQIKILSAIATQGALSAGHIASKSIHKPVVVEHAMDDLGSQGYLKEKYQHGSTHFEITPKGRAYLVEHGKEALDNYEAEGWDNARFDY